MNSGKTAVFAFVSRRDNTVFRRDAFCALPSGVNSILSMRFPQASHWTNLGSFKRSAS